MSTETVLRNMKKLYEVRYLQEPKQLYHVLFPLEDMSIEEKIALDEYIQAPVAVAYRDAGGRAHVRKHVPGSGATYTPPVASEETPMDEILAGQVEAGVEATAGYQENRSVRIDRILSLQLADHNMTKNKQAIDLFRAGIFYAKGLGEADIGLHEDYSRDADNSQTPDFTDADTITTAFSDASDQLDAKGCPADERFVIVGSDWLKELRSDTAVLDLMKANLANVLVQLQINPPTWAGVKGLSYQGTVILGSMTKPIDIFTYVPGVQYKATQTDTDGVWLDSDEAIFGSWQSPRYRVFRGILALDGNDKIIRTSGELVFDSYVSRSPVAEFLRSTSRHLFLPADVDHTLISTGTFS